MIRNWQDIMQAAGSGRARKVIVAGADDTYIVEALAVAKQMGLIEPVLVGPESSIANSDSISGDSAA